MAFNLLQRHVLLQIYDCHSALAILAVLYI